jgi:hypothetical protein
MNSNLNENGTGERTFSDAYDAEVRSADRILASHRVPFNERAPHRDDLPERYTEFSAYPPRPHLGQTDRLDRRCGR